MFDKKLKNKLKLLLNKSTPFFDSGVLKKKNKNKFKD